MDVCTLEMLLLTVFVLQCVCEFQGFISLHHGRGLTRQWFSHLSETVAGVGHVASTA